MIIHFWWISIHLLIVYILLILLVLFLFIIYSIIGFILYCCYCIILIIYLSWYLDSIVLVILYLYILFIFFFFLQIEPKKRLFQAARWFEYSSLIFRFHFSSETSAIIPSVLSWFLSWTYSASIWWINRISSFISLLPTSIM